MMKTKPLDGAFGTEIQEIDLGRGVDGAVADELRSLVLRHKLLVLRDQHLDAPALREIGRRFGGRDHTTVLHAVRKIEALVGKDTTLNDEVEALKRHQLSDPETLALHHAVQRELGAGA